MNKFEETMKRAGCVAFKCEWKPVLIEALLNVTADDLNFILKNVSKQS